MSGLLLKEETKKKKALSGLLLKEETKKKKGFVGNPPQGGDKRKKALSGILLKEETKKEKKALSGFLLQRRKGILLVTSGIGDKGIKAQEKEL